MARLRYNGLTATLGADLLTADTTVTFTAALTSAAGAVPTLAAGEYIPFAALDADGNVSEVFHLTAYTSGATTGTVARAKENTAAADHNSGLTVVHGATALDVDTAAAADLRRVAQIPKGYLSPVGLRFRGANLTIKSTHYTGPGVAWSNFYDEWDWANIQQQIDRGLGIGVNAFRLIGCVNGVTTGMFTLAEYVARYEQFVDYCAANGAHVYACGGDPRHLSGATLTQISDVLVAQAQMLETKSNVVGFDLLNETESWTLVVGIARATMNTNLQTLLADVREVTTIPLALSRAVHDAGDAADMTMVNDLDADTDVWDFHFYDYDPAPTDLDTYYTTSPKPFVIGEFGISASETTAAQEARYEAIRALAANNLRTAGAFAWALQDQDTVATNQYGLFDSAGTPRVTADVLETFPVTVEELLGTGGGGVETVVAGTGIAVDSTDPANPVVSLSGGGGVAGSWATYTPTWTTNLTAPTLGNGTLAGRYVRQADDTVHFSIALVIGSTTTVGTGTWTFSLPVTAVSRSDADATVFVGSASMHDVSASGGLAHGYCYPTDTTKIAVAYPTSTTAGATAGAGAPYTWAAGDIIRISGTYQAAP